MKDIKGKIKHGMDGLNSKMTQVRRELLILGNSNEEIAELQHRKTERKYDGVVKRH